MMACNGTTTQWKAPQFSFNTHNQTEEWKTSYTRVLDILETLDFVPKKEDQTKCGWRQIKMMFQGEDGQALQTLINNNTITSED